MFQALAGSGLPSRSVKNSPTWSFGLPPTAVLLHHTPQDICNKFICSWNKPKSFDRHRIKKIKMAKVDCCAETFINTENVGVLVCVVI